MARFSLGSHVEPGESFHLTLYSRRFARILSREDLLDLPFRTPLNYEGFRYGRFRSRFKTLWRFNERPQFRDILRGMNPRRNIA